MKRLVKAFNAVKCEMDRLYSDDEDLKDLYWVEYGTKRNHYKDGSDMDYVEVRAELSYDDMLELSEKLDLIISKYDEDAYFDMVDSGIMMAVIS